MNGRKDKRAIYMLLHKDSGYLYIGSTIDFARRLSFHRTMIRNCDFINKKDRVFHKVTNGTYKGITEYKICDMSKFAQTDTGEWHMRDMEAVIIRHLVYCKGYKRLLNTRIDHILTSKKIEDYITDEFREFLNGI